MDVIHWLIPNMVFVGILLVMLLIKGFKSENIEVILGYRGKDEVVHRDDFVLENY